MGKSTAVIELEIEVDFEYETDEPDLSVGVSGAAWCHQVTGIINPDTGKNVENLNELYGIIEKAYKDELNEAAVEAANDDADGAKLLRAEYLRDSLMNRGKL